MIATFTYSCFVDILLLPQSPLRRRPAGSLCSFLPHTETWLKLENMTCSINMFYFVSVSIDERAAAFNRLKLEKISCERAVCTLTFQSVRETLV
jgi:hypothetical protein